jgi:hypothetical protein
VTQANDSILVTAGTGPSVATHAPGDGKEYQVVMLADESGHLVQTLPTYSFFIKVSAGAGAKDHFDIFNAAGSGKILEIRGLWLMPQISGTAVTGAISPDFDFYRTSAVGTGGTVVSYKAATFPSISPMDTANANLPAQLTMRAAPTGGATIAEALFTAYVTQEETQAGAQLGQWFNTLPDTAVGQRYTAREGQGFKLRQITAGVGQNFSVFGVFTLV